MCMHTYNVVYIRAYISILIQKKCSFCRQTVVTPVFMRVSAVTLFFKKCRQGVTTLSLCRCVANYPYHTLHFEYLKSQNCKHKIQV